MRTRDKIDRGVIVPSTLSPRVVTAVRTSEDAGEAVVVRAMSDASRTARSSGPEGAEHLLETGERKRFEALYPNVGEEIRRALESVLASFQADNAPTARAVILRAILARLAHLSIAAPGAARSMVERIEDFAEKIRPLSGDEILRRTTVIDLDSRISTHHRDPLALWDRRGVIHPRGQSDDSGDDDGLIQRFSASCGPAVIQMLVAEADPIFAYEIWESGLTGESSRDRTARFQRKLLEHYGGIAIGLREGELRSRVRNAVGRLVGEGHLPRRDGRDLLDYLAKRSRLSPAAKRALAGVRRRFEGLPSEAEVKTLRRQVLPERDEGLGFPELADALAHYVTPLTGVVYRQTSPPEGFARGQAWRHLDAVARALRSGVRVPFGLSEPSHWMMMTAVEGRKPNRRFLVSDPLGGRTDWVLERDIITGRFASQRFQLNEKGQRPYIDSFFLP
jgi:hypothetical protein